MTELGAFMRTEFFMSICIKSNIGIQSALNPTVVYSTDRSETVVPVLVLIFVTLWFILRGDLFYDLPCAILFLCFSVLAWGREGLS